MVQIPYFCGFFLTGFNILMISFLQATRQTGKAMVLSLLRSVILPPALLLLLPVFLGREAVWVCQSAADALTALFAICFLAFPGWACYSKLR